jgi:Trk-type K+ transport system membrane component
VLAAALTMVLVASMALVALTQLPLDYVVFDVISAFATCGLSLGITPDLPAAGKAVLIVLMFLGRTGTMTLAAALALRERPQQFRLAEERPIVG